MKVIIPWQESGMSDGNGWWNMNQAEELGGSGEAVLNYFFRQKAAEETQEFSEN